MLCTLYKKKANLSFFKKSFEQPSHVRPCATSSLEICIDFPTLPSPGLLLAPLSLLPGPLDPQVSLSPRPPKSGPCLGVPGGHPGLLTLYRLPGGARGLWPLVSSVPTPPAAQAAPQAPDLGRWRHREGPSLLCPESPSGLCSPPPPPGHFSLQLSERWPSLSSTLRFLLEVTDLSPAPHHSPASLWAVAERA